MIDESESHQLDYAAVRVKMIEVQQDEDFLPEESIQSLKFSLGFINRYLTKHELLYGSSNCDQKSISTEELQVYRAELALKLRQFKANSKRKKKLHPKENLFQQQLKI